VVSLRFYFSDGIQYCIALSDFESNNFSNIMREIIKKSLFTERQIEIILKQKDLVFTDFAITKGAYYRQVSQSRDKLTGLYYSFIVLKILGVILPGDVDVMSKLSEQVSVIKDGDVFPEREQEITNIIERVVKQTVGM
jgi:hypothetical protein